MLKFLRSLVTWTASNHGVLPAPSTQSTPSTRPTSEQMRPGSVDLSALRLPIVEKNKKQRDALIHQLTLHEGMELKPYRCTGGKLSIGVGRNLDDRGITEAEAQLMLSNDIDDFADRLKREIPWMAELSPVRQRVLLDMAFNLGISGLLKFKRTLKAIRAKQYEKAAEMMLDSRWATQVGQRAKRLSKMMATGHIPPELI
tara:strand:- start:1617 stop:2216 length:600 start_codon:yes stop_codon:yes gene_type:complete